MVGPDDQNCIDAFIKARRRAWAGFYSHMRKSSLPGLVFFSQLVYPEVPCRPSVWYPNSQAARDAATSHKTPIHLLRRIHFFLQCPKVYTEISLADELTESPGKIMAQLLSILALSTRMMAEKK